MAFKSLLLFFCFAITNGYAQENAILQDGTRIEVRVVSVLNKKGKKEKLLAFTNSPVTDTDGIRILIKENSPVRISVNKKNPKKENGVVDVNFTSVQTVSGEKVLLYGTFQKPSRVVGKRERTDKLVENLTMAAFGFIPKESLPKKKNLPDVTLTSDVFVRGDYKF